MIVVHPNSGSIQDDGEEDVTSDSSPLLSGSTVETQVYKRRWYVLILYSLLAMTQGSLWNTWGPIAASAEEAFGWTDGDISLLAAWGPIAYLLVAFLLSWVVDVKGLRWASLITGFLVATGSAVRCITDQPPYVKWTVNIGQILNGLAGPCADAMPPVLSATWFPAGERVTATAISITISYLGSAVVDFLVGPYMVTEKPPDHNQPNTTSWPIFTTIPYTAELNHNDSVAHRIAKERKEIMTLLYVECAWSVFVFLMLLAYFPAKPPKPPTVSASLERIDFTSGAKILIRNARFWCICLTYGISLGVFSSWQSVLDITLKPHDISQKTAGWVGFYATLGGCVGTVVLARLADYFSRHIRILLVMLYTGSTVCFVWFSLIIEGTIPNSTVSLYIAIILATLLLNSAIPLYFEMACEVSYPVAEGITNFALTFVNNVWGLIFLGVQMIRALEKTGWENWAAVGAIATCIPVLLLFKERYNRLDVDEVKED